MILYVTQCLRFAKFLFHYILGLDISLPWLTPYRIKIGGKENALVLWASSLPITSHNSIRVKNLFKSHRLFRLMPHPCRNLLSNYWETRYSRYSKKFYYSIQLLFVHWISATYVITSQILDRHSNWGSAWRWRNEYWCQWMHSNPNRWSPTRILSS